MQINSEHEKERDERFSTTEKIFEGMMQQSKEIATLYNQTVIKFTEELAKVKAGCM